VALSLFDRLEIPYEPAKKGHGTDGATLRFLYDFLQYTQPSLIVEAGTFEGSFVLLAHEACPDATIYTADICMYDQHDGVEDAAIFCWGDFRLMLEENDLSDIDFAFIDSGPPINKNGMAEMNDSIKSLRATHYNAVLSRMRKGGIVATHDTRKPDWDFAPEIIADAGLQLNCGRGLALRQI